ncbi:MAG: tRNA (adenosine(37)-N6)-threonylcarbamoyltransferase complex dimerization subunit type 1 TsaB [Planctomycetota bacterium]
MTAPILAIDVTGPGGGAALAGDRDIATGLIPPDSARGRDLIPQVKRLLDDAGLALTDLGGIACAIGPGSFTGIRIGIATAATLAYAEGLPVLPLGSLHGIAAAAPAEATHVAVALNARREHVFAARFTRRDGALEAQGDYEHVPAADFAASLPADTCVLGDAREAYEELFARFPGTADVPVRPDVIARLARDAFARGEGQSADTLRPMYLRLSDPELRRQQTGPFDV